VDTWQYPQPIEISDALRRTVGHPLIAEVLTRRGVDDPDAARAFLDPEAYVASPASAIPDLASAAAGLVEALDRGERILVWGDFDVDGQTATSLLFSALRDLGAQVRAYIPRRLQEGHGIRLPSLRQRLLGTDVLLTCDTGVSEHEAIAYANAQDVTVIVTDHHDLPPTLPPADAVVDPKRLPEEHPLRELPGVAVAYKLIQELHRLLGHPLEETEATLDLVALGIVADVALQTADTRYLLQLGMQRLRSTRRIGLQALMASAQIEPTHLTTDHIGFGLGPRLNALGRLGDANLAVELLTTDDLIRARTLAAQLEGLNSRRRLLTEQIYAAAQHQIAEKPELLDFSALVVSGPRWHPGVIGIVASRLVEKYERPVVMISEADDGVAQGSARSVAAVDIHAAITAAEDLLSAHGGHPGAAGLSLPVEAIDRFRRALSRAVDGIWDRGAAAGLKLDATLPWQAPSLELVDILNRLAPFGHGNPPVTLLSRDLELVSHRLVGRDQAHRVLSIQDSSGTTRDVIWWRGAEHPLPSEHFDLAYYLKASDYRGERSLQLEYIDGRLVSPPTVIPSAPSLQIMDQRGSRAPQRALERLQQSGISVTVWAEGYAAHASPGLRRDRLIPADALVIWTPPPGPRELQAVLDNVSPTTVHLFAVAAPGIDPSGFVRRLAGLVKYTLRRKAGVADLAELAAASGQRMESVRLGIRLLHARGDLHIVAEGDSEMQIAPGDGKPGSSLEESRAELEALLNETAAYRAYFARAPAGRLLPSPSTAY
jgi:single-stranded-DNA-specific exonuclease